MTLAAVLESVMQKVPSSPTLTKNLISSNPQELWRKGRICLHMTSVAILKKNMFLNTLPLFILTV